MQKSGLERYSEDFSEAITNATNKIMHRHHKRVSPTFSDGFSKHELISDSNESSSGIGAANHGKKAFELFRGKIRTGILGPKLSTSEEKRDTEVKPLIFLHCWYYS